MTQSNKPDKQDEQAFLAWLEQAGKHAEHGLAAKQAPEYQDKAWQQRQQVANTIADVASRSEKVAVPAWSAESSFDDSLYHNQAASGSNNWLPYVSLAFSCCALLMVVFKVEFSVSDQGMMLSFAGAQKQVNGQANSQQASALNNALTDSEQQQVLVDLFAKKLEQRLSEFSHEQQLALAKYSNDWQTKQQTSNLELLSYVMSTARQERKEDLADLVSFLSQQRKDEQVSQDIRFKQLEQAVLWQTYQDTAANQIAPTNWQIKE